MNTTVEIIASIRSGKMAVILNDANLEVDVIAYYLARMLNECQL